MKRHNVRLAALAEDDLEEIADYLTTMASPQRALAYVRRVREACEQLRHFPRRGTAREDLRPGLRTIGFERRITIVFSVADTEVLVMRILYGGRDMEALLRDDP